MTSQWKLQAGGHSGSLSLVKKKGEDSLSVDPKCFQGHCHPAAQHLVQFGHEGKRLNNNHTGGEVMADLSASLNSFRGGSYLTRTAAITP